MEQQVRSTGSGHPTALPLFISLTLVTLMALSCREVAAIEPTTGYTAVQRAFLREDFATTASLAQAFLLQNQDVPEAPRVWIWLALSLDRLQRSSEALKELDHLKVRLKGDDPLWPEVLFWEGEVSRRALQIIRAKLAYQRLLERYPQSSWTSQAQMGLGLVYLHQQACDVAIGYFHEVALRQATEPIAQDARLFEGLCRLRMGQLSEAVAIFEPLTEQLREPTAVAQVAFYLGEGLTGLKRYDEAIRAYQRALVPGNDSPWRQFAQFGLGWAYYRADRCDESLDVFAQYLSHPPAVPSTPLLAGAHTGAVDYRTEAFFAEGSCLLRLGREHDALSRFEYIIARNPTHPLAVESGLVVAEAYRKDERFVAAKELLHRLLREGLDRVARAKIQLQLASIALDQGNTAQARTLLTLASDVEEPSIRQAALNGLGDVQMFLGDVAAASQFYHHAIQILETTTLADYATYQLGRIQLQAGTFDGAIRIFQRLAGSADSALADDAKLALALAYLNQHEEHLARSLLETIRQQQPTSLVAGRAAYYLALLALGHDDEESAYALSHEAMAKAPRAEEALDARLLLAEMLAQRTSVRAAMGWLRDAYTSSGLPLRHQARLAKRLADFARSEGQYAEAIRWYEIAAHLLPSLSGEATYRVASCFEEVGDLERAMQWYEVIEQPPWHVRGQLALAKLLEREDRQGAAEAIYEQLSAEPIPEAKVVQERLAALRGEMKNKE